MQCNITSQCHGSATSTSVSWHLLHSWLTPVAIYYFQWSICYMHRQHTWLWHVIHTQCCLYSDVTCTAIYVNSYYILLLHKHKEIWHTNVFEHCPCIEILLIWTEYLNCCSVYACNSWQSYHQTVVIIPQIFLWWPDCS